MIADLPFVVRDGVFMCVVVGAMIAGLFLTRPRFFLKNYSEAVREVAPPLSDREKRLGTLAGLPLFAALLGFPTWSAWSLDLRHGGNATAMQLFLAAYGCFMMCNLFDWLVIDVLWLGHFPPRSAVLRTEHVPLVFGRGTRTNGTTRLDCQRTWESRRSLTRGLTRQLV